MHYIKDLLPEEIVALKVMHKNHPLHLSRRRAHAILLSDKEHSVPLICSIYNVCRQTVSTWFSNWEKDGIDGLVDSQGRGRRSILTEKQPICLVQRVEKSPRSLKSVLAKFEEELGISVSIDTIKRICLETS